MAKKIKDLAVKTGEYTTGGQTKGRWLNIGSLMQGDDGGMFVILQRTFNPAGVPNPEGRDSVLASAFDPKEGGQQPQRPSGPPPQQATDDDPIPF